MLLDAAFIHRFGGPDGDLLIADINDLFQVNRVNAVNGFVQCSFGAQEPHLFGRVKQLIAKRRMRDADHGHCPFLQTFTK